MEREYYIGLMSGTSLDGVDGVLCRFGTSPAVEVAAHAHLPFEPDLATELLALNSPGENEVHRAAIAANRLMRRYADAVDALLAAGRVSREAVAAIGAHGQTVRHRPGEFDGVGYTVQLAAPALLAELAGIDVVADFRSRDVAAGGQGAPLVPAFHRAVFGDPSRTVGVLNLGGIANLSLLRPSSGPAAGPTTGFDCGPANALMDHWCQMHTGAAFDADGAWAAAGRVDVALLARLLAEPYFDRLPPKSTGRDLFNPAWLGARLAAPGSSAETAPQDVQATLAELTARTCADAWRRHAPDGVELLVGGGGALNGHLMRRLAALLPGVAVAPTDTRGLPATQVEACAFAWLARAWLRAEPGNLADVTGSRGARRLGALYPAR